MNVKCLLLRTSASSGVWRVNSVYIGGKWTELLLLPSGADDGDYADNDDDEVTTYSGHTSLWNIRVAKYVAEYMLDIIMWCMTLITHSFANTAYCAGDLCKFHVCVIMSCTCTFLMVVGKLRLGRTPGYVWYVWWNKQTRVFVFNDRGRCSWVKKKKKVVSLSAYNICLYHFAFTLAGCIRC